MDFNPRSPRRERQDGAFLILMLPSFQSTLPSQGATSVVFQIQFVVKISIHAPLAGSDQNPLDCVQNVTISIHAPLAGSDVIVCVALYIAIISIHAPLAGSDKERRRKGQHKHRFQSTLPSQGATIK